MNGVHMSTSHAQRAIPEARGEEHAAVPYLRRLQQIALIRWWMRDGEWGYTTIVAQYLRRDDEFWYLLVSGAPARLPREEWAIFS